MRRHTVIVIGNAIAIDTMRTKDAFKIGADEKGINVLRVVRERNDCWRADDCSIDWRSLHEALNRDHVPDYAWPIR